VGMDVIGMNPTSDVGREFRHTCDGWHPLAEYVCEVAPEITSRCTYWHSNDYDGLSEDDARGLAEILQNEIDSGRTETYALQRRLELAMIPNERCSCCNGTGTQKPSPGRATGDVTICGECDGRGYLRPEATEYVVSAENVQWFADFLRACGGFEIW
jgi:hypothetical protein